MSRDPQTPAEWQEAVNAAQFFLELESSKMYGLMTGGPVANMERCEEILRRGKDLGYIPEPTEKLIKQFLGPA